MPDFTIYLGFLLAGLAGSLHCIGMCGPILVGATNIVNTDSVRINGKPLQSAAARALSQLWYHFGRIMTYALLGSLAGLLGRALIENNWFGWSQHYLGMAAAGFAILFGLFMLIIPYYKRKYSTSSQGSCTRFITTSFHRLAATPSIEAKLILGALMGFLPCGLVYSMLVLVAATANPLTAALGMIAFGLGTIPALSGVVLASGILPINIRKFGQPAAAILIIMIGSFMFWRAWPRYLSNNTSSSNSTPAIAPCPLCEPTNTDSH